MALPNLPQPFTPSEFDAIMADLDAVKAKINARFDLQLTKEQILEIAKIGDRMEGFVDLAAEGMTEFGTKLPDEFDRADFDLKYKVFKQAEAIEDKLRDMTLGPHNTSMLASSGAMRWANLFYGFLESLGKISGTARAFHSRMAAFYKDRGHRHDDPKPPTN